MAKQLNKLSSIILTVWLGISCLYFTFKGTILSYFKKNSRSQSDNIIRNFAYYILKPLKINFIKQNWHILEQLPDDKPIILMSNHSSLCDIPILLHTMPANISLRMLAKKELTKLPIFGKGMVNLGCPTVDRKNRKQAMLDLEHTKHLMQNGIVIWAAPEGTRSEDGSLLKFKKGIFVMAIELNALIIPIGIKNADKVLPAKSFNYSIGESVTLCAQQPVDASLYKLENRDQLVADVRTAITEAMKP